MAAQIGSLYVSLTANVAPYAQNLSRAEAITSSSMAKIRSSAGVTGRSVDAFWGSVNNQKIRWVGVKGTQDTGCTGQACGVIALALQAQLDMKGELWIRGYERYPNRL